IFYNQGTFLKSAGDGVTDLHMQLYNSGTVTIEHGSLNIHCGYVQVIGNPGGGGGTITGNFTGEVSVSNPGQIIVTPTPLPPVPVTNYTQTETGSFTEVIGGLIPGTEYGQIIVSGNVSLAGTLQVSLTNNFAPSVGDQFTVIDNRGPNPIDRIFSG